MRRTKKIVALALAVVLSMAMSMTALAADNYKTKILQAMDDAATTLGVQNSTKYKNAYASVEAYDGTITEAQYNAALNEISAVQGKLANWKSLSADELKALEKEIIAHVENAAAAVGITIKYDGNGVGEVTTNKPIKDTGSDYAGMMTLALIAVAAVAGCAVKSRKFA